MSYHSNKRRKWLFIGIAFCLLGFVTFNMRDIIFGAHFSLSRITDGATVHSLIFPISGEAPHAKVITLNGRPVAIDRSGKFADEILLSPGYNIVEVALHDRFGKEKTKTFHLYADTQLSVATATVLPVH